ncbi:MAG: arylesterase [Vicinamibacterales bacterium]
MRRANVFSTVLGRRPILVGVWVLACVAMAATFACGSSTERSTPAAPVARSAAPPAPPDEAAPSPTEGPAPDPSEGRIVVLGDSLTAGLGLSTTADSFPSVLQERLRAKGFKYQVVNAGVSGDTSAGGLSRLGLALDGNVRVLIVALGGNDALRGLPAEELKRNLSMIIERAQARAITVILAGMEAPPNFGQQYTAEFRSVYPALAKQYRLRLVPFLLQGVAGDQALNQRDGIHPTAAGARIVADNVWAVLEPVLNRQAVGARGAPGS